MREGDGVTDRQEIEQPQIDGEALTGVGVSAIRRDPSFDGPSVAVGASAGMVGSAGRPKPAEGKSEGPAWMREMTQEAPNGLSGDPGARVDGSGASVSVAGTKISDEIAEKAAEAAYEREHESTHGGWYVPWAKADGHIREVYVDSARAGLAAVVPLIRAQTLREYADRWHYVDHSRWPMSTFGAAPTPYCACGKTWPEGGCTERRNLIADAGTAEFDRLWAELENAPEHPGTGQPTEGVPGEVSRG